MAKLVIAKGCHGVNKLHVLHPHLPATEILLFFPGDRIEKFGLDPEIQRLQDPSEIAAIMSEKFPQATVVVIIPSRGEAGCSCYEHFFTKLTLTGEPLGYNGSSYKASEQLYSLLEHAGFLIAGAEWPPVTVVGFSKGGVLVNQLLAELAEFSAVNSAADNNGALIFPMFAPLLRKLHQVHYLDAGLNCRGAYLTDPALFEQLGKWRGHAELEIVLHGTPRQWEDPSRPFIAQERDRMISLCHQNRIPVRVDKYFDGERPSLAMHFQVVAEMRS